MSRGQVALLVRDLERIQVEMRGTEDAKPAPVPPPGLDKYERGQFDLATLMGEIREVCKEIEDAKSHSGKDKLPAAARIARDNDLKKKVNLMAEKRKCLQEEARQDPKHRGEFEELDGHIRKTQEYYGQATGTIGSASTGPRPRAAPALAEGPAESTTPMLSVKDDVAFITLFQSIQDKDREIDVALTAIGEGVGGLLGASRAISTELDIQGALIQTIDNDVERQQVALDGLNANVKKALKEVNSESCCMYVLCIILLLAICGGIYSLTKG